MRYLQPLAHNPHTGHTVKSQDLSGYRYTDRAQAQRVAESLAEDLTARTGQTWVAGVRPFDIQTTR